MIRKTIMRSLPLLLAVAALSSCMSYKQLAYLQDMKENSQIELENKFEAVIATGDELTVLVSSYDTEIAKPFNVVNEMGRMSNGGRTYGYLVDVNGEIQFPVLGKIKLAGLTRLQAQDKIAGLLKEGGYISDPYVFVRFVDFKVFFLGTGGGKAITIPNERCTFLEALALAGDLNAYTRRDKIAVMREVNGKMTVRFLDPRSSKVFNDPYFTLQQNDFIITRSFGAKYFSDEMQYWMMWVTTLTSLLTTASVVTVAVTSLGKK